MKTKELNINGARYGERELAQLIRRKMITQVKKSKKLYQRHPKHKQHGIH